MNKKKKKKLFEREDLSLQYFMYKATSFTYVKKDAIDWKRSAGLSVFVHMYLGTFISQYLMSYSNVHRQSRNGFLLVNIMGSYINIDTSTIWRHKPL